MAKLMLLSLAPITFIVHDFWTIESDEYYSAPDKNIAYSKVVSREVPVFPSLFDDLYISLKISG